ncbi:unnamed protein product [Durusdinium trenchii]|uniref:Uncharacterized protein n=1 Tax=Durusdinium trenchii TaxID=1381693 RepID=A0ABP0I605_9DINO
MQELMPILYDAGESIQLIFMIIAEVFFISIMALILSTLYEKEYQLAAASLELEEKVEEVKQAERSGVAAQRLLAVTCDASARLTGDLRVAQPSPSLSDLLMCGFGRNSGCNHLEGVPFMRYVDASDQQRLKEFVEESAKAIAPPRSIHLQMRDSGGISFNAELFHVSVPSLTSEDYEHLIGINQENSERALHQADEQPGVENIQSLPSDMRHILGYKLPQTRRAEQPSLNRSSSESDGRTRSSQEASSKTNNLVRLRMLKNVNFVVDVRSDDFVIYSVHLDFAQTHKCPMEAMPKLLEWVKPNYRSVVNNWVQEQANAHYASADSGRAKKEHQNSLRGIKIISPMQSARTLLAGEVTSAGFHEPVEGDAADGRSDVPGSDTTSSGKLLMSIKMRHLFAH